MSKQPGYLSPAWQTKGQTNAVLTKKRRWHLVLFSIPFTVLTLLVTAFILLPKHPVTPLAYQDGRVTRGTFLGMVQVSGLLQSQVYNLSFQSYGGIIGEIDVHQGEHVKKGQLLARLRTETLQSAVDAAQTAVKATRNNVRAALLHEGATRQAINTYIALAETNSDAAQANQAATSQQTDTSITTARVILASNQRILAALRKAAYAQIRAGKAQMERNLAVCQTLTAASLILTPTPTPSSIRTPMNTQLTAPSAQPSATTTLDGIGADAHAKQVQSTPLDLCQQAAKAQYQQTLANAHLLVVGGEAQVQKDRQAIKLAAANGNVAVTSTNGQVNIARKQITAAKNNPDKASVRSQVIAARGQFEIALAQLRTAKQLLANATLFAPHNGTVTAINGTIGGSPGIVVDIANSAIGSASSGAFIQLVDVNSVGQILLNVNETDILKLDVGQPVQFTLKAYNNRQFTGTISAISPNGISQEDISYPVIVTIDPQSIEGITLLPNMTANATITTVANAHTLLLPASAIQFASSIPTGALIDKQANQVANQQAQDMLVNLEKINPRIITHSPRAAFVIQPSSNSKTYVAHPIVIGLTNGKTYEILQGLNEGETIITGPIYSRTKK